MFLFCLPIFTTPFWLPLQEPALGKGTTRRSPRGAFTHVRWVSGFGRAEDPNPPRPTRGGGVSPGILVAGSTKLSVIGHEVAGESQPSLPQCLRQVPKGGGESGHATARRRWGLYFPNDAGRDGRKPVAVRSVLPWQKGGASVGRWDHSDAAAVLLEDAIGLHLILPSQNRPVRRTGLKMATRTRTRAARQVRCLEAWSRFPTALHSRAIEAEGGFP